MFSRQEGYEIFASLGGTKEDATSLQKFQEISNLESMGERRNFFSKSSSVEKSNFWKIHLAYSFVKFPTLSKEQTSVILDTILLAKPKLYELDRKSPDWQNEVSKPIEAISNRALALFPKEIGVEIYLNLGGEETSSSLRVDCNCSQGSIPACWDRYCVDSNCHKSDWGCGVIWVSECNGKC